MGRKRVFSGTRATGRLHLGNYLGAVKGYLELAGSPEYETIFMVMDLHAITTPFDKEKLAEDTKDVVMDYLACGLDPEKSIITAQSLVPEHAYLAHLLSAEISVARMQHLPTFKEKVTQHPGNVTMALLNYPVLMAADILVYKASLVPVGIDQEPHLEVAREIARKMNQKYGTDFPEPKRFATKGEYVPSLTGEGKMSKSVEGSYINLTDDLKTIKTKIAKIPTDKGMGDLDQNFEPTRDGPLFGVISLVRLFQGDEKADEYKRQYVSTGIRYGNLKEELAEAIYKELKPIQEQRKIYENDPSLVDKIIKIGAERAGKIAGETIKEVKEKMGFIA
jgi:tryptophanyl-tRNA synthetase